MNQRLFGTTIVTKKMNGYDNNIERLYNYFGVKTKRLTIADSEGNTRMEGVLNIQQNADNTEVWHLLPFKDYRAVVLASFYSDGESIFKDVTDNYKKTYPHIKKVELQAICAIEELEPDK